MKPVISSRVISKIAIWTSHKLRSSKLKRMLPNGFHNLVNRYLLVPLVKKYDYSEYLKHQLLYSAWSREVATSQIGLKQAYEVMQEWFTTQTNFLDLGCGDGYILDIVKPQVKLAIGIDYHLGKLAKSIEYGNLGVCGDIHKLPFRSRFFNVVHMSHVLEHSISPNKLMAELTRVMTGNGQILIVVPQGGATNIKHPNTYHSEEEIRIKIGKYLDIVQLWRDNTREPEFWIIGKIPHRE